MRDVTKREFKKSFKTHYDCYRKLSGSNSGCDKTRRLILFYCVECGLKCELLKREMKNTYKELWTCEGLEKLERDGHNLNIMLKKAGVEARFPLGPIRLRSQESVGAREFNQLWRYGIETLDAREEDEAEKTLANIAKWLDEGI